MKVSIITATKNSCSTFERSIVSYLMQDYAEKEYVVVDGLSKDCTLDLIAKHRNYIDVFVEERGSGIYSALNLGIKLASGEVIGLLHSDDFFAYNEVLSDVMREFERGADIVYGDVVYILPNGKVWRYWKAGSFRRRKLFFGWMPPHTTFFVRRELFFKYGFYREDMHIAADFEMVLRLMKQNLKVGYVPKVLTVMSAGGTSNKSLGNIWLKMKEDRLAAKLNGYPGWVTVFFKNFRKSRQLFQMLLAKRK